MKVLAVMNLILCGLFVASIIFFIYVVIKCFSEEKERWSL